MRYVPARSEKDIDHLILPHHNSAQVEIPREMSSFSDDYRHCLRWDALVEFCCV
jgi:hypothetical protein